MFLESSRSRPSTTPLARIWAVPRVTQQRAHGRGQYPTPRSRRSLPEAGTILGVPGTAGTVQEVEPAYRAGPAFAAPTGAKNAFTRSAKCDNGQAYQFVV